MTIYFFLNIKMVDAVKTASTPAERAHELDSTLLWRRSK